METYDLESLCKAYRRGKRLKYMYFWGHKKSPGHVTASCFSQWYEAGFKIDGLRYPTAEHFMMAEKARLFQDRETERRILKADSPGEAKQLGRQVRDFDHVIRERNRFDIVCRGNAVKFSRIPELKKFLLKTGNRVLVEASPVDKIWGVGLAAHDSKIDNPLSWDGLNLLGFALMKVRDEML